MLKPTIPEMPASFSAVDAYAGFIIVGMGLYGMGNSKGFPAAGLRRPLPPNH
jgi:hypothetical protein